MNNDDLERSLRSAFGYGADRINPGSPPPPSEKQAKTGRVTPIATSVVVVMVLAAAVTGVAALSGHHSRGSEVSSTGAGSQTTQAAATNRADDPNCQQAANPSVSADKRSAMTSFCAAEASMASLPKAAKPTGPIVIPTPEPPQPTTISTGIQSEYKWADELEKGYVFTTTNSDTVIYGSHVYAVVAGIDHRSGKDLPAVAVLSTPYPATTANINFAVLGIYDLPGGTVGALSIQSSGDGYVTVADSTGSIHKFDYTQLKFS